jgi:hypothetical protein
MALQKFSNLTIPPHRHPEFRQGTFMISNWLSAALARRNIHYGWVMVGVTFLHRADHRRRGRRARRLHRAAAA